MSNNNVKPFSGLEIFGEGNVTKDAKFFEGSNGAPNKLFVTVAFNTKNYQGHEETQYFDVHYTGFLADQARNSTPKKGQRVFVSGRVYPAKDFDQYHGWIVEANRPLSFSSVFQVVETSKSDYQGGGDESSSRSKDTDDDPIEQSTSRSRNSDDDGDMGNAGLPDGDAPARGRGRGRRGRSSLD